MQKDLVFFKKEGEEGVALTSTSANHIANLAKEYILGAFKTWKDEKSQEYSKLKIVVPNSLLGIYNTINSLGK